jgi:hypothetical protein
MLSSDWHMGLCVPDLLVMILALLILMVGFMLQISGTELVKLC